MFQEHVKFLKLDTIVRITSGRIRINLQELSKDVLLNYTQTLCTCLRCTLNPLVTKRSLKLIQKVHTRSIINEQITLKHGNTFLLFRRLSVSDVESTIKSLNG